MKIGASVRYIGECSLTAGAEAELRELGVGVVVKIDEDGPNRPDGGATYEVEFPKERLHWYLLAEELEVVGQ